MQNKAYSQEHIPNGYFRNYGNTFHISLLYVFELLAQEAHAIVEVPIF